MYQNVRTAEALMKTLMNKGWTVICPHLSYHAWLHWDGEEMPWERWIQMDEDFVERSDALFYMLPNIYGESRGALHEFELAKKLKKTIYTDMKEVPTLNPKTGEEI